MKKIVYLGVDQTGAIDKKGRPLPLPACVIRKNKLRFFYLKTFSKQEILNEVKLHKSEELVICIDCVLGLPLAVGLTWREALKNIRSTTGYGRAIAQKYFQNLGRGNVYHRQVEIECKANSVFKERPYQRNIQTGTYRFWKDISTSELDFYVPFLEKKHNSNQLILMEGYPSLSWKRLFSGSKRCPESLTKLNQKYFPDLLWSKDHQRIVDKDPNLADAFVLALSLKKFENEIFSRTPSVEGWILGAPTV